MLIATGARDRRLMAPGERELIGSAIHFCAMCDAPFYRDKDVLVVGGGNSGFQEGLFIKQYAKSVTIVEFLPEVREQAAAGSGGQGAGHARAITNHAIQAFRGQRGKLLGVDVMNRETGEQGTWRADGVFIFIGQSPNTEWLPEAVQRAQVWLRHDEPEPGDKPGRGLRRG